MKTILVCLKAMTLAIVISLLLFASVASAGDASAPIDPELRNTIPQVYQRWLNRCFVFAYRVEEKMGPIDDPILVMSFEIRLTIHPETGRYVAERWGQGRDAGLPTRYGFCRWDGNALAIGHCAEASRDLLQRWPIKDLSHSLPGTPQCETVTLTDKDGLCRYAETIKRAVGLSVAGRGTVPWLTDFLKEPRLRMEERKLPLLHELTLVGSGRRVTFDADTGLLRRTVMPENGIPTQWSIEALTEDHLPSEILLGTGEKGDKQPAMSYRFWAKDRMCRIIAKDKFEEIMQFPFRDNTQIHDETKKSREGEKAGRDVTQTWEPWERGTQMPPPVLLAASPPLVSLPGFRP